MAEAQNIRDKFDLYITALSFTLLAAAVQTMSPWSKVGLFIATVETLAATALLVSGLLGLFRVWWLPNLYSYELVESEYEDKIELIRAKFPTSNGISFSQPSKEEVLSKLDEYHAFLNDIKSHVKKQKRLYSWRQNLHLFFLITGILCLFYVRVSIGIKPPL